MALQERLAQLDKKTTRPGTVQRWIDTLPDDDRSLVLTYMGNRDVSNRSLLQALKEEGAPFGKDALAVYRTELWKSNVSK